MSNEGRLLWRSQECGCFLVFVSAQRLQAPLCPTTQLAHGVILHSPVVSLQ